MSNDQNQNANKSGQQQQPDQQSQKTQQQRQQGSQGSGGSQPPARDHDQNSVNRDNKGADQQRPAQPAKDDR